MVALRFLYYNDFNFMIADFFLILAGLAMWIVTAIFSGLNYVIPTQILTSLEYLISYLGVLNGIFPVATFMTVLGSFISFITLRQIVRMVIQYVLPMLPFGHFEYHVEKMKT